MISSIFENLFKSITPKERSIRRKECVNALKKESKRYIAAANEKPPIDADAMRRIFRNAYEDAWELDVFSYTDTKALEHIFGATDPGELLHDHWVAMAKWIVENL